ncbi:hypothetical protein KR009_009756, partial [Drosophila setifemur]
VYTEEETNLAMTFIQEHKLPMSDLRYALKYVRILHGGEPTENQIPEDSNSQVAMVEPPPFDWDDKENLPVIREL